MFIDPPTWIQGGFSAALGLVMGSFLNVVIARVPEGRSIVRPGSSCPGCGSAIRWRDNIPVLSYAWLRGKCRRCRAPISIRYPVVELLTGLLFAASALKQGWGPSLFLRDWPFLMILVAVTFIDLSHLIIPDRLSLGGLALGLGTSWMETGPGVMPSVLGASVGFGVFYLLAWAYQRATGRSGLGGGDIKLLAMLGAFLGPTGVFCVIFVSSIAGSLVGIAWGLATRRSRPVMQLAIPYGPFLVIGGLYYYLMGESLWLRFTIPT